MLLLCSQRGKGLRTHWTPVGILPGVPASVNSQQAFGDEAFPALFALVRPLPRVVPHVKPQLSAGEERLAALGAQVVLLPSVHAHVPCQVLVGGLATNVTLIAALSCVGACVHVEEGGGPEPLAAVGAEERCLARVDPIVDDQGRFGQVPFVTLVALIWRTLAVGGCYI